MNQHSERTDARRKPRFPRLALLKRRRKEDRKDMWYCTADDEGLISVRPPRVLN